MALFPLLAVAVVGFGTMGQKNSPYDEPYPVIRVLCEMGLASLICLVALAGLLISYHRKLKRSGEECARLTAALLEPHWDKPEAARLPGSDRGSDDRGVFQDVAEVSGCHDSLDPPSWRANRLCG
jgi:hypothetical protein